MKGILFAGAVIGAAAFAALFLATFFSLDYIDRSARGFVIARIESEISDRQIAGVKLRGIAEKFNWLKDKYGQELEAAKQDLKGGLRTKITEILAKTCLLECLKKNGITISDTSDEQLQVNISKFTVAREKLGEMVKGKYYRIIHELLIDLRIFSGVNLLLFSLITALLCTAHSQPKNLLLPASLLFAASISSSAIYIFGQDWFYTLLFSNYMGWGYLSYVGVIFGLLLDIVFNRASISVMIIDGLLSVVGSILNCLPGT